VSKEPEIYRTGAGEPVARQAKPPSSRTSAEIRADIERQREELGQSVEALRNRVTELTDWRRQVREHRRELVIGAAVAGLLAYRAMQAGSPPVPAMAIEEGKRIKQTLESGTTPAPGPGPTPS
jgi:hypothetical protein